MFPLEFARGYLNHSKERQWRRIAPLAKPGLEIIDIGVGKMNLGRNKAMTRPNGCARKDSRDTDFFSHLVGSNQPGG